MSYKILGCSTTCYPLRTNHGKMAEKIADMERVTFSNGAVAEACGGSTSLAEHQKHGEVA